MLLPIAFVLGIVGVFLSGQTRGTSIAAVIVSIVGGVAGVVVFFVAVSDAFGSAFNKSDLTAASPPSRTPAAESTPGNPPEGAQAGTRENPLPIGRTATSKDWTIALGEPREAGAAVAAENPFNSPPKPGMQFWIVPVTAIYTGEQTGSPTFGISVKFVGSDNRTYADYCGVIPSPLSDFGELYKGGTAEGNVCVAISSGMKGLWTVSSGFGKPVFFTD